MRRYVLASLVVTSSIAVAQQRPAAFADAVRAMGGEAAIRAATSLTVEVTGRTYNFGQGMSPSAPLPRFDVSAFRRTTDLTAVRPHQELTRPAALVPATTTPRRLRAGLDGDHASTDPSDRT